MRLIEQLRACENAKDGYEFQRELLAHRLAVEDDRNALSQAVKRMRGGKQPQAGAPQPQSGQDIRLLRTWQLEYGLCERVARQLQCAGDALAWRVFGFQRRHIVTLSRNDPPGVMAGKQGLIDEREAVKRIQVGLPHAGKTADVLIEADTCQITVEGSIAITVPRKTSHEVKRRKASNYPARVAPGDG